MQAAPVLEYPSSLILSNDRVCPMLRATLSCELGPGRAKTREQEVANSVKALQAAMELAKRR